MLVQPSVVYMVTMVVQECTISNPVMVLGDRTRRVDETIWLVRGLHDHKLGLPQKNVEVGVDDICLLSRFGFVLVRATVS